MSATIIGGSLLTRRDAIARDYTVAFSLGPVAIGDTTEGHHTFAWRARVEDTIVYVSRVNNEGTEWGPEQALFNFEGPAGREIDIAFDQNGGILISLERSTGPSATNEIWLYWFNPVVGSQILDLMGPGRTPRLVLDNVEDTLGSDVILFSLNDTNQRCEYRTQRELFEEVLFVPVDKWFDMETKANVLQSNTENMYIEDVIRSTDYRLHVVASFWNPITGTYRLLVAESKPYRVPSEDKLEIDQLLLDAETAVVVIDQYPIPEGVLIDLLIEEIRVFELTMTIGPEGEDGWNEPDSLDIESVVEDVETFELTLTVAAEPDKLDITNELATAETDLIVIEADNQFPDELEITQSLLTATVSVP